MAQNPHNISIIILAGGSSSRLGKPKQLLVYHNETLIKRIVKTALKIQQENVFVVSGLLNDELKNELKDFQVHIIHNSNWADGMGSSIQSGIKFAAENPEINAVLVLLSDQPLITFEHLQQLITQFYTDKNSTIVATKYADTVGVPAIFDQSLFDDLLKLPANRGAQSLFKKYHDQLTAISFEDAAVDIDTVEDYEKLLKRSENT